MVPSRPRAALLAGLTLAACLLTLLAACNAEYYHKKGMDYLAEARFDDAVEAFGKAVEMDPEAPLYQESLQVARRRAADHYYTQAQDNVQWAKLATAEKNARKALQYQPGYPNATALLDKIAELYRAAEARRGEALRLADAHQYDQAFAQLREAMKINRELPGLESDTAALQRRAANHYNAIARRHLAERNWNEADKVAAVALRYDPNNSEANVILQQSARGREADLVVASARQAMDQGRHAEALSELERAERLSPGRPEVAQMTLNVKKSLCDSYIAAGQLLVHQKRYPEALAEFEKARALLPNYGNVARLIESVRIDLASAYKQAGDVNGARKRWGAAMVYYALANAVWPTAVPQNEVERCRQQINARISMRVGLHVATRSGKSDYRQAAVHLRILMLRQLLQVRPEHAALLTEAQFRQALAAGGVQEDRLLGPTFQASASRLTGLEAVLVLDVASMTVTTTHAESKDKVRYQSGLILVENPAYAPAVKARDAAQLKVQMLTAEVTKLNTQRTAVSSADIPQQQKKAQLAALDQKIAAKLADLQAANTMLAKKNQVLTATPEKLARPRLLEHIFAVHDYKRVALLRVTAKMYAPGANRVLLSRIVAGQAEANDRFVQADQAHHVAGDPLELPSEAMMRNQAVAATMPGLATVIEQALFTVPQAHYSLAVQADRNGDGPAAIEQYVNFLFAESGSSQRHRAAMESLTRLVPHARGMVSLRDALVRHCPSVAPGGALPIVVQQHDTGLWLTNITAGSRPRDVKLPARIVSVADKPVHSLAGLQWVLGRQRPGDLVTLEVQRDDQVGATRLQIQKVAN